MSIKLDAAIEAVRRAYNKEGGADALPLSWALQCLEDMRDDMNGKKEKAPN